MYSGWLFKPQVLFESPSSHRTRHERAWTCADEPMCDKRHLIVDILTQSLEVSTMLSAFNDMKLVIQWLDGIASQIRQCASRPITFSWRSGRHDLC